MPRTSEHSATELKSRTARHRLPMRSKPYFAHVADGLTLGYRRAPRGGSWIARRVVAAKLESGAGRYQERALGSANDAVESIGMTFQQANSAALEWFRLAASEDAGELVSGSFTVAALMAEYLADRQREKRKPLRDMQSIIEAHIIPALGTVEVSRLTHTRVKAWRDSLAASDPRNGAKDVHDAMRKRHATANRIFTTFRAAMNFGFRNHRIATKAAWERIAPFQSVSEAKVRYLSIPECKRLIEACPSDFKQLVQAALYTGCRYGELIALKVGELDSNSRTLHIAQSKSGKSRHVRLNDEAATFFASVAADRDHDAPMFVHAKKERSRVKHIGEAWNESEQRHWMVKACKQAKIEPAISFHILRHTLASHLAMRGNTLQEIASQLGHAGIRMTEKHYAHLSESHVAERIVANIPSFGFSSGQQ